MMVKESTLLVSNIKTKILNRDTFLGNFHHNGCIITADSAGYVYTGVQAQYKIGALNLHQVLRQVYTMKEMVKILDML
jgi:hypothetical protein